MSRKIIDLTGKTYVRLTVMGFSHIKNGLRNWECKCECGKTIFIPTSSFGRTKSCGCYGADLGRKQLKTHGESKKTKEYRVWSHMKGRCFNEADAHYADYGGRGITVCERWLKYENFLADMGRAPSENHTLDRYPNNDGNYELSNCRWATKKEQANNRRSSKLVEYDGELKTISQWCDILNLKHLNVRNTMRRRGKTLEQICPIKVFLNPVAGPPVPK